MQSEQADALAKEEAARCVCFEREVVAQVESLKGLVEPDYHPVEEVGYVVVAQEELGQAVGWSPGFLQGSGHYV